MSSKCDVFFIDVLFRCILLVSLLCLFFPNLRLRLWMLMAGNGHRRMTLLAEFRRSKVSAK